MILETGQVNPTTGQIYTGPTTVIDDAEVYRAQNVQMDPMGLPSTQGGVVPSGIFGPEAVVDPATGVYSQLAIGAAPLLGSGSNVAGLLTGGTAVAGGLSTLATIARGLIAGGAVAGGIADILDPTWGIFKNQGATIQSQVSTNGGGTVSGNVVKTWHKRIDSKDGDFTLDYYLVQTSRGYRIYMYNPRTKRWKSWALPKPAVIGKNLPSHKMLTRLRRNLKRHADDANTILRLTNPVSYAKRLGYRKYKRR